MASIRKLLPVPATPIMIRNSGSLSADMSSECLLIMSYACCCISLKLLMSTRGCSCLMALASSLLVLIQEGISPICCSLYLTLSCCQSQADSECPAFSNGVWRSDMIIHSSRLVLSCWSG